MLSKIVVELQHFAESVTNLSLALRFSSNLCAHAQNYGEWWRIEEICEKLSKSKKFVEKTPFPSKSAESGSQQYNSQSNQATCSAGQAKIFNASWTILMIQKNSTFLMGRGIKTRCLHLEILWINIWRVFWDPSSISKSIHITLVLSCNKVKKSHCFWHVISKFPPYFSSQTYFPIVFSQFILL